MSVLIPNEFSSYALTEEEEIQGSILTLSQIQVMSNDLAMFAAEKISLEFDSNNPDKFLQQEAYKRAQIDTMKYILERSDSCIENQNNPA